VRPRWWWLGVLLFAWPLTAPQLDRADAIGYLAPALSLASDGDVLYHDGLAATRSTIAAAIT
jgi:hypothetical protein